MKQIISILESGGLQTNIEAIAITRPRIIIKVFLPPILLRILSLMTPQTGLINAYIITVKEKTQEMTIDG